MEAWEGHVLGERLPAAVGKEPMRECLEVQPKGGALTDCLSSPHDLSFF